MAYFQLPDGMMIAYHEAGAGPITLLLIHGLGSSSDAWQQNMPALSQRYHVVAIDLPGYGRSEHGEYAVSMSFYARVVRDIVQLLDAEQVVLVGHSMGGQVVLTSLLSYDLPVAKAILIAPAGLETFSKGNRRWLKMASKPGLFVRQSEEQLRRSLEGNFYSFPDSAEPIWERLRHLRRDREALSYYAHTVTKGVRAMLDDPVFDRLPQLDLPVLLICGEEDGLIPNRYLHPLKRPSDIARQGQQAIPDSTLVMIPEAGHFVQWEKAAEVNRAIATFVGKSRRAATAWEEPEKGNVIWRLLRKWWNGLRKAIRGLLRL